MTFQENISTLLRGLPSTVTLVAVTKGRSLADALELVSSGITNLGESRVQEALQKYGNEKALLRQHNIKLHLIGHLQKNKARKAVQLFDLIQSVDSINLAQEINKHAHTAGKLQDILLQVNIGNEPQKHGFTPEETIPALLELKKLSNLSICGLMAIAPHFNDPEQTRPYFRAMKALFDAANAACAKKLLTHFLPSIPLNYLSMGMSSDYPIAVQEGATMVRIGRKLFAGR